MREMNLTIDEILAMTGGRLLAGNRSTEITAVSSDSSTLPANALFVALAGERFDGHDFVAQAVTSGAAALLVSRIPEPLPTGIAVIGVSDTLTALGDIAHGWRLTVSIPVIALTGTSGKTSTKDLIRACLATEHTTLATAGNLNNLIGVPQTLFQLTGSHDMAVIEMGMNRLGEIARLAHIAAPQYGLITNIGDGHTEGVGGIDGVARAKGELLEVLGEDGCFFANMDDPRLAELAARFPGDVISYGFSPRCDFFAHSLTTTETGLAFTVRTPWEEATIATPFWGKHHLTNALAAIAVAQSFQVSLSQCATALAAVKAPAGRGRLIPLEGRRLLLDEAYNANPLSTQATLTWFASLGPAYTRRYFVFGTMKELGAQARTHHLSIIDSAAKAGTTDLYLYGEFAEAMAEKARELGLAGDRVQAFDTVTALSRALQNDLLPESAVAVKASHSCGFEAIVHALTQKFGQSHD